MRRSRVRRLSIVAVLAGSVLPGCSALYSRQTSPAGAGDAVGYCTGQEDERGGAVVTWSPTAGPAAPRGWCSAVGPAVAVTGPTATESDPADTVVLASWNIRAGAGDLPRFVEDLRSGAITGNPESHFVLLIQEAYRSGPEVPPPATNDPLTERIEISPPSGERLGIDELASRLRLHVFYAPSMPNGAPASGSPEDRGNAILSTLPLRDFAAVELPFEVQRRVAVAATVSGLTTGSRGWNLRVASGHLDTRSPWSRVLDSFGAGRARQARALSEFLEGDAAVLGADLNTWSFGFLEDAPEILARRFPDTPELANPTFHVAGIIARRLDHVLARLPDGYRIAVRVVPNRYGSDHRPIIGILHFDLSTSPISEGIAAAEH